MKRVRLALGRSGVGGRFRPRRLRRRRRRRRRCRRRLRRCRLILGVPFRSGALSRRSPGAVQSRLTISLPYPTRSLAYGLYPLSC